MEYERPSWEEIFLSIASNVSERASCERLQVGCVITSADSQRILAFGYNGNYAGGPNGCDDPEAKGRCGCIHAEVNALLKCDNSIKDKVVYVTHAPCLGCAKAILNSGASRVVFTDLYTYTEGIGILEAGGVKCDHLYAELVDEEEEEE